MAAFDGTRVNLSPWFGYKLQCIQKVLCIFFGILNPLETVRMIIFDPDGEGKSAHNYLFSTSIGPAGYRSHSVLLKLVMMVTFGRISSLLRTAGMNEKLSERCPNM